MTDELPPVPPSVPYFTAEERAALIDAEIGGTRHCRHYSYERGPNGVLATSQGGGPLCAVGIDLRGDPGASKCCWPDPKAPCAKREEVTAEERRAEAEEFVDSTERTAKILPLIQGAEGASGSFACPACGTGTVRWVKAGSKRHIHAGCSTEGCFGMIQ